MKKNILVLLALLVVLVGRASASEYTAVDQSWWSQLGAGEKIVAVQAMLDGYEAGFDAGGMAAAGKFAKPPAFTKPVGKYIDGVDLFYRQHPALRDVLVSTVLPCMADQPVLSCDKIAQIFSGK